MLFAIMDKKTVNIILIAILILGSFLRVYGIGSESFWIDEAATMYTTRQAPSQAIRDIYTTTRAAPEFFETGGTPPLYYVLANYWTKLIGLSEAKLRLLSVLFGTVSIYVIFLIGNLVFDYRAGLLSAFILSINYAHINYSQEARTYSLMVLLSSLSIYFLIKALKENKIQHWSGYVLSSVSLIYTHYFGFLLLITEYLFLLFYIKNYFKFLKRIIVSGFCIFLLYLPWFPAILRQVSDRGYLILYLGKNLLFDLLKIFIQFNSWLTPDLQTRISLRSLYHFSGDFRLSYLFNVSLSAYITVFSVLALALLLSCFFMLSIVYKNKKTKNFDFKDNFYVFVLMWFTFPLIIIIIITLILPKSPVFGYMQHVLFVSPAYYLLVANGITKSGFSKKIIILVILLLSIFPIYSYYANYDKSQWREAIAYLKDNRYDHELIVMNAANNVLPFSYYNPDTINTKGVKNVEELKAAIKDEQIIWLILSGDLLHDPKGTIKGYLDDNYKLEKVREFSGLKLYRYVK